MPEFYKTENMTDTRRFFLSGLIFFIYSLGLAVAIQIYIIPKTLPQLDFGEGIAILDSTGFNQTAKIKAEEIRINGWGAWELRPQAHSPAGIASIFYALWVPKPYSLLPFNALVHALSGCLVFWLMLNFFSWKPALLGSALFVVNPAAMQWVSQIHRDGVFILGNLMVLSCLIQFWCGLKFSNVRSMIWAVILGVAGSCLVWVARPYWIQVLIISMILSVIIIFIYLWMTKDMQKNTEYSRLFIIPSILSLLLFQGWLVKIDAAGLNALTDIPQTVLETQSNTGQLNTGQSNTGQLNTGQLNTGQLNTGQSNTGQSNTGQLNTGQSNTGQWAYGRPTWKQTAWIPTVIDGKLYQISQVRRGAVRTGGNTVVDTDIALNSASAFVAYLPRALQLGFLSPLPELWQGEGSTPTMTIARKVMGVATIIFYICLLGVFVGIYLFRTNPIVWLLLMFCSLGIMVFIYAYPNIGTFLRFRYGFYMLLIAFGAANIVEMSLKKFAKHHNK